MQGTGRDSDPVFKRCEITCISRVLAPVDPFIRPVIGVITPFTTGEGSPYCYVSF